MRKIVFIAFAFVLTCVLNVRAEFVRPDVAARYAQKAMGMSVRPQADGASTLRAASRDGKDALPCFYIFNNPDGGWMIISADDRISPVLAYSDYGQFSTADMPENLEWWINGVERTVDDIRNSDLKASAQVQAAWRSQQVMTGSETGRKVLVTANWNQEEPYNMLCPVPKGDNKRSAVGCEAVATAIMMRYNKWPAHGKGLIGGYTTWSDTYVPAYSIDNHTYNWDDMPLSDCVTHLSEWTEDKLTQVAQLMHDCGVMEYMQYTSEAAYTSDVFVKEALIKNMSYSESARCLYRSNYDADEWFQVIKREIDEDRVVLYTGHNNSGGHAYVCDGYDVEERKLHFNWGWGGANNGFFTTDIQFDSWSLPFTENQSAIIGLCPENVHIDQTEQESFVFHFVEGLCGIQPVCDEGLAVGSSLSFRVGYIWCTTTGNIYQEFKICLFDKDGNLKQEGWRLNAQLTAKDMRSLVFDTEADVLTVAPEPTDTFKLYMKQPDGTWTPVKANRDYFPDMKYVCCGAVYNPVILLPDDYSVGQTVDLKLSLCIRPVKSVKWSVNGQASDGRLRLESGKTRIRADVTYLDDTRGYILRTVDLE